MMPDWIFGPSEPWERQPPCPCERCKEWCPEGCQQPPGEYDPALACYNGDCTCLAAEGDDMCDGCYFDPE